MLIPHCVGSQSRHILSQRALDKRSSSGARRHITGDERKTPGGSAVPKIFYGWVVVQCNAVYQFFAGQLRLIAVAYISVVHAEVVVLRTVSHLQEAAYMRGPCACDEQRNVLREFEIPVLGTWLRRFCAGK